MSAHLPLGRRPVLLQHAPHRLAQAAQLVGLGADDVARHDRRGCLTEGAGLHVMGEVGDRVALHLEVDGHGRAAELGMGGRRRIGVAEPAQPGDIPGELKDAAVVDLVQHDVRWLFAGPATRLRRPGERIYMVRLAGARRRLSARRAASLWREAGCGSHVKWECGVRSSRMGRILLPGAYD